MTGESWPVVLYNNARDNISKPAEWNKSDIIRHLCHPRVWSGEKVMVPSWSPVVMTEPGAQRLARNVAGVSMLVLDCDRGEPIETMEALGDEYIRVAHTSWSHTPQHPKVRLVFPFEALCPAEHWPRVWRAAARWAAERGVTVDAAAKDASRLYFLPYVPMVECEPGGNPHLEEFESWAYDSTIEARPGMLPPRVRTYMSWAHIASRYPDPEPEPLVVMQSAGRPKYTDDMHARRRRAFAMGMLEHRCQSMIAAGEGGKGAKTGRNNRTFALARLVARLAAAGSMDLAEGVAVVEQAAITAGLKQSEYARVIRNGLAAGDADGPEDIDAQMRDEP